jgi:hypothetical protein
VNPPKTFADTHADLLRHAELYGTDCVYETARHLDPSQTEDLATLKVALRTRIEMNPMKKGPLP